MSCSDLFTAWKVTRYIIFSDPYFPIFGLNTEIHTVNLGILSEFKKMRTIKNSLDTFHAVMSKCYIAVQRSSSLVRLQYWILLSSLPIRFQISHCISYILGYSNSFHTHFYRFIHNVEKWSNGKMVKVCLVILRHYAWKS